MTGYNFFRRALEEKIGEIQHDIDRNAEQRVELMQELWETEEALAELEESKDKFIGERE